MSDELIGQVVDGRYRIRRVLGRGGMGVVYEAESIRLGKRLCAIKVLLPEFTRNPTVVARFEREAEVAASIKHPNVVEIFDTGQTASGLGYIAMELLVGESLDRTLKRSGPLPWPRAQKLLLQVCDALAVAHAQRIVHRDIKPENLYRCTVKNDPDYIKVLDFGIAKLTDLEGEPELPRLTASNSVIGTYSYMSFEQVCGEPIDARADIWAVGVLLYEMVTGRLPFRGTNQGQIWRAITLYDPEPLQDLAPDVPHGADEVVQRALAKRRDARFPTIEAFAQALADVVADTSPPLLAFTPPTLAIASRPVSVVDAHAVTHDAREDERPTLVKTPSAAPLALTELAPDPRPPTQETVHSVVTPSTHPGIDTPPRPRETMQTDIAPLLTPPADLPASSTPEQPPTRRRAPLIALGALVTLSLPSLLYLNREPEKSTTTAPTTIDTVQTTKPPATTQNPEQPPVEPALQPAALDPVITESSPSIEPDNKLVDAKPIVTPTKKPSKPIIKTDPKPAETLATILGRELRRVSDGDAVKDCFTRFQPDAQLLVDIEIDASTGSATLTYDPLKRRTTLATCLDKAFSQPFTTGTPGDANFKVTRHVLNRQQP